MIVDNQKLYVDVRVSHSIADCSEFVTDLQELNKIKGEVNSNVRSLLSKIECTSISPSFIGSFLNDPFDSLKFLTTSGNVYTNFGSDLHKILEVAYKDPEIRTPEENDLLNFKNNGLISKENEEKVYKIYNNYITMFEKPFVTKTEHFIKGSINKFGIQIPNFYCLVDRLDEIDGKYILYDYKTTYRLDKQRTFEHYMNQMYAYKLVLENQGIELSSIDIIAINANTCKNFDKVNFPISLKYESIVIENILHFKDILEKAKNNNWSFPTHLKDGVYNIQMEWKEKNYN